MCRSWSINGSRRGYRARLSVRIGRRSRTAAGSAATTPGLPFRTRTTRRRLGGGAGGAAAAGAAAASDVEITPGVFLTGIAAKKHPVLFRRHFSILTPTRTARPGASVTSGVLPTSIRASVTFSITKYQLR